MSGLSRQRLLDIMGQRYDYYSARTVLREAERAAGLDEQEHYSGAEIERLVIVLAAQGSRQDGMLERIRSWAGLVATAVEVATVAAPAEPVQEGRSEQEDRPPQSRTAGSEEGRKDHSGPVAATQAQPQAEAVLPVAAQPSPKPAIQPEAAPPVAAAPPPEPVPAIQAQPQAEAAAAAATAVEIVLRAGPEAPVSQVVMTGEGDTLGNWDPTVGLALEPDEQGNWRIRASLPAGEALAFKFVVVLSEGSRPVWERGGNHAWVVPTERQARLEIDWQGAA